VLWVDSIIGKEQFFESDGVLGLAFSNSDMLIENFAGVFGEDEDFEFEGQVFALLLSE